MEEKTKKAIDSILDTYAMKQESLKKEAEKRKTEHERFLERFEEKARTVIRPCFQEIGTHLRSKGHDFEITQHQEEAEKGSNIINAAITLLIYPNNVRPRYPHQHSCPHVAVMANPSNNRVFIHESTTMPGRGGSSGGGSEYGLDQITPAVIDKHIIKVLSEAMGR